MIGQFMPPHAGHVYLLEFAQNLVDRLAIVIDLGSIGRAEPPFSSELRSEWLSELVPRSDIKCLSESFCDQSGVVRAEAVSEVTRLLRGKPDIVFGANESSLEFAAQIQATYVPIDTSIVPVKSADLLSKPLANWERIPRCVRPHFVKRVCIFGPESTGKSTLSKNLAKHYQTVAVPEYARVFLDSRDNVLDLDEFKFYARGQLASEDALARSANRVLFCDTDALTTLMWSEWLYKEQDPWIVALAEQRNYDLYLLTDVDVPWVFDPQRYLPEERKQFHDYCKAILEKFSRRYVEVKGSWDERFETAVRAVDSIMLERSEL